MKTRPSFRRSALALGIASCFAAPLAAAAPGYTPRGGEFKVADLGSLDSGFSVATDANSNSVVAWRESSTVRARVFTPAGFPMSSELMISIDSVGISQAPRVAMEADGDFVVVWDATSAEDLNNAEIYARRYKANGTPLTGVMRIVNTEGINDISPRVAVRDDGDFVVAWTANDGSLTNAYAQVFNASGQPLTTAVTVNGPSAGGNRNAQAVAMEADGDFVVAWDSYDPSDGKGFEVRARRFNSAGVSLTAEIQVNASSSGNQMPQGVSAAADGSFVVSWSGEGPGDADGVYVRRFNAAGLPLSAEIRVNTVTENIQSGGDISMDSDGDFVVAWTSYDALGADVYARWFKSDATPLSGEFRVNEVTDGLQGAARIAMEADGDFVASWISLSDTTLGIYARRFRLPGPADLSVIQTDSTDPVQKGSSLTYSLTVTNSLASPEAASGIRIRDTLPAGSSYLSFSADSGWSCASSLGVVTCDYGDLLAIGHSQTVDLTVNVPSSIGRINNQVTVSADNPDPSMANNSDGENTQVCDPAAVDTVGFMSSSSSKSETAGSVLMNVTRSGGACTANAAFPHTEDGSAKAGQDYTAVARGSTFVSWAAGEQGKKSFSISLLNDTLSEDDETFKVLLTGHEGTRFSPMSHVVTVKSEDPGPAISMNEADTSLPEASGGGVAISAVLAEARGSDLTMPLVFSGTARRDVDYSVSGPMFIPAGNRVGTIVIRPINDTKSEDDETVVVSFGDPKEAATPTGKVSHQFTLTDDDLLPKVAFAAFSNTQPESKPKAGRIVLSEASERDVTVSLTVISSNASSSDYVLHSPVTIKAGKLEAFALTVTDDAVAEPFETVVIGITEATGAKVQGTISHTHGFRDDD